MHSSHHSSHQQDPNIGWLFLKNSPNATSMSPKKRISTTLPFTSLASAIESNLRTSPDFNLTIGPSIESTGTTQLPFPGLSIFNWVPTARNSSNSIVAGWTPIVARPVLRDLPYLSLNPPFSEGYPSTGLPPMISWAYLECANNSSLSIILSSTSSTISESSSLSSDFSSSWDEPIPLAYSAKNSQLSRLSLFAIFKIFLDFWITPSTIASKAPPRILLVSTRGKSLWDTSIWSVGSPLTSTGMLFAANLTSSGVGEYWRFVTSDS